MADTETVTTQGEAPATETAQPTPEAKAPKSFKEHYAAAKAATGTDDTAPAKDEPAQDPEKTADEPPETVDETTDTLLTKEELAALPPKERAKAEKWQAKLTRESQRQSEYRKNSEAFSQWKPLVEALQSDPEAVLNELAQRLGHTVTRPGAPSQDTTTKADILPPELKFLEPIFEAREKEIEQRIRAELAPVKDSLDRMTSEAIANETDATIKSFEADPRFKDWKKHEPRMLEIATRFAPVPGQMNDREYMEHLYTLATASNTEAEKTKKVIARIEKAAASVEPSAPSIADEHVEHAIPPKGKRDIRAAWAAAKNGVKWVNND